MIPAGTASAPVVADVGQLLRDVERRIDSPDDGEITWGTRSAGGTTVAVKPQAIREAIQEPGRPDVSDHARELARKLLELQTARRLSDNEVAELADLSGHVVELAESVEIEIDQDGAARVAYHFDLLNLTDRPITRMTRELWFEHTTGPLAIKPSSDSERRLVIQRIHDTANLAKFAFQISPPLRPGEAARVGYVSEGGKFDVNHYWRQAMPRYTRRYTLHVRQRGIQLGGCTASEEHPDGSENSATDSLVWDYDDDAAVMSLNRGYLRPGQAVTLRWDVIRGPA